METLIAEGIGKTYKGRQVVRGVNLSISRGEVVGLLGPNGAGKTTSFYMIVGLVPPETGRVMVDDQDITRVPMYLRARNYGISYLPQEPSVFRKLTVEENILAVLEAQPLDQRTDLENGCRIILAHKLGRPAAEHQALGKALLLAERDTRDHEVRETELRRALAHQVQNLVLRLDCRTIHTGKEISISLASQGQLVRVFHIFDHQFASSEIPAPQKILFRNFSKATRLNPPLPKLRMFPRRTQSKQKHWF